LLQEQLATAKDHSEAVSIELAEKTSELAQLELKHQQEEETHAKKVHNCNKTIVQNTYN